MITAYVHIRVCRDLVPIVMLCGLNVRCPHKMLTLVACLMTPKSLSLWEVGPGWWKKIVSGRCLFLMSYYYEKTLCNSNPYKGKHFIGAGLQLQIFNPLSAWWEVAHRQTWCRRRRLRVLCLDLQTTGIDTGRGFSRS